MNLLKIKIIVLLERLKKVTLVAEELGLKQPTVSFHMRKMEEEYGLPLFEIKTGKVILTEAGKLLHHYAVRIERLYEEAESRLAVMRSGGNKRKFAIGTTLGAAGVLTDTALLAGLSQETRLQLSFITGSAAVLEHSLLDEQADLIITSHEIDLPGCICQAVGEEQLVLLLRGDHPAAAPGLSAYRLAQYPIIMPDDESVFSAVRTWEAREQAVLALGWSSDRIEPIVQAVRAGQGISLIPGHYPAETDSSLIKLPFPGGPPVCPLYAVWRSDSKEQMFIDRFIRMLMHKLGHPIS